MDWYDDYSIHDELIDTQHKELFAMVTRLQKSLSSGGVNSEIATVLKFLVEYTRHHFHDEEELMAAINFPELKKHRLLHQQLIADIRNILLDLKKGKTIHPFELIDFLTDWLLNHVRHEDKKIGRALEQKKKADRPWDGTLA